MRDAFAPALLATMFWLLLVGVFNDAIQKFPYEWRGPSYIGLGLLVFVPAGWGICKQSGKGGAA